MHFTVEHVASLVGGQIHGNRTLVIQSARTLQEAGSADISFLESERNLRILSDCCAGALVIPRGLVDRIRETISANPSMTLIEVADPLVAFVQIAQHLRGPDITPEPGIDPQARVHPTARVGPDTCVEPFAVIGAGSTVGLRCQIHSNVVIGRDCRIGDDVILYPGVVLYDRTVLGDRVVVHSNSVLGADGFGYRFHAGKHVKVPQLGHVEIGDDVEIGACATIDRGTFQATRIGSGTKIDNLVMIAHNCQIGQHNLLVSQVGIAGSCVTGDYVVMAGQVGVADHVTINDRAVIGAGSGVPSDVPAGVRMLGYPAWPEREAKRILLSLSNLPSLCKDVRQIKQQLGMKEAG